MKDKLSTVIAELTRFDESLIDKHGLGLCDGYTHEFLVFKHGRTRQQRMQLWDSSTWMKF